MIELSPDLALPDEAVTDSLAVIGRRSSGKTYTAKVMAEGMLTAGQQVVVIDPTGVWWGLRSSASGKGPGFPIVVLGGDEADVPLEPTGGELVADLVVDSRVSCVLDVSHMRKGQRVTFLTAFAERLYHRKGPRKFRTPLHLMVDEAHAFVPQRPQPNEARMLGAGEDLVQMGRSRGIGVTLISQRPAVVNKNVLSQVAGVIALQLTSAQDRKAMGDWITERADTDARHGGAFLASLASLKTGHAIVWVPHLSILALGPSKDGRHDGVKIRKAKTFDSSATPKVGETPLVPTGRATVDLDALTVAMADTIQRAQADDPKALRRRIAELERALAERPDAEPEVHEVVREVMVIPDGVLRDLGTMVDLATTNAANAAKFAEIAAALKATTAARGETIPDKPAGRPPKPPRPAADAGSYKGSRAAGPAAPLGVPHDGVVLKDGARRMLKALAKWHPGTMTEAQIATAAGLKRTGGTWGQYWAVVRRHGLVAQDGGEWTITEAGFAASGQVPDDEPLTRAELVEAWRSKLKAGARTMLDLVLDPATGAFTRAGLAEAAGLEASGGTFGQYLGAIKRTGLVEVEGDTVRASDLFMDAAA